MDNTVLDRILSNHPVASEVEPIRVTPDEIVHVVGTQEPVRDQPDERAQSLRIAGWLTIEHIRTDLPETERSNLVAALQQAARAWLKQSAGIDDPDDRDQVRWMVEKTRSRESKQQIAQRVWLAAVLYGLGYRHIAFDQNGQIRWKGGVTGRIGLSPDAAIDLAQAQASRQVYTASFRHPDGTITRGKGRHRWYIYRLTVDPQADFLFERRKKQVEETVALIVASETHATQPQLPRDFYGGNEFQQACIDAQDQQFDHILVLSPEHGVLSLDDVVPSDQTWDVVLERRIWSWQIKTVQHLGAYLFGDSSAEKLKKKDINWWAWLNPNSVYRLTIFGGGFAVRILVDHITRAKLRSPESWPTVSPVEQRPGYDVGDLDDNFSLDLDVDDEQETETDLQAALQDIDQLLEWSSEFATLVNVYVPPTGEFWDLAPDEAMIPVRLLSETSMDIGDLLDLLTDMTLLIEQPLPVSMLINANMLVSVLLQITHSLVHDERDAIPELLDAFPEGVLIRYIENVMQEPNREDQLCACLTLAEQAQLLALTVPSDINDQLLVWLQTYLSSRMRHRLLGDNDHE